MSVPSISGINNVPQPPDVQMQASTSNPPLIRKAHKPSDHFQAHECNFVLWSPEPCRCAE